MVYCPAPPPRLPHLAPRPLGPGGWVSPEKAEPRRDGSAELGLRGPGPGRLIAPPGLGLGMAQPRPSAPQSHPRRGSLPAGAGWQVRTMAGAAWPTEDPGPSLSLTAELESQSGSLCLSPVTVGVCVFGLIPGLRGAPPSYEQFSTAAPGSDVGTLWPWTAVTLGVCVTVVGTACCLPHMDGAAISQVNVVVALLQVGCPASGHTTPSLPLPCVRASAVACGAVTVGVTCCCVCTLWVTVPCVSVYVGFHCGWLFGHLKWVSSLPQPIAGSLYDG